MITALMPPCPTPRWRCPTNSVGRSGRRGRPTPSTKHGTLPLPRIPRRPWRVGFEQLAWRPADRAYAGVLEALTRERTALLEQGREIVTPARPQISGAISLA